MIQENANTDPTNSIQTVETSKKAKNIIIILAIFAIAGLCFGGFELWQNTQKNNEISNLKNQQDTLLRQCHNNNDDKENKPNVDTEQPIKDPSSSSCTEYESDFSSSPFWKHIDDKTIALLDNLYSEYDFRVIYLKNGQDETSEIMKLSVGYQTNKKTGEIGGSYMAFYYRVKHGDEWTLVHAGNDIPSTTTCSKYDKHILEAFANDSFGCNE